MIYTHSILAGQGFFAETHGIVRDRQHRQRQVSRLHRLGPGALARFIEAIIGGADIPSTLSSHANESRSFLDSLHQTLPYGRWIALDGTVWLFNRHYAPIWRKHPNKPVEAVLGSRGEPWVEWVEQHWFFGDHYHPFRKTPESRALRRDLDGVQFWRGDFNGPIAKRLIAANEKENARQREIWDASLAKVARRRELDGKEPSKTEIDGGAP